MYRRTFNNWLHVQKALEAAEALKMGYTLTKGRRTFVGSDGREHWSPYWWLDLADAPTIVYAAESANE